MTLPVGALVRDLSLPALGYGRVVEARGKGAVGVLFQSEPTPREVRPAEQREVVRKVLSDTDFVKGFKSGDEFSGGWGATIAELRSGPPAVAGG